MRIWIWWVARQEKLTVSLTKIDAPFLGPVTLRGLHVTASAKAAFRFDLTAKEVKVRLNFRRLLLRTRDRPVRNITASDVRLEIHGTPAGEALPQTAWSTWQKLLPDSANFERTSVRVENGATVVILRGGSFSAAEIESGRFTVDEFTIASPIVRRTFSHLRGATQWQNDQLTFAGVSLTRGLDLESLTLELAYLSKQRIGIDIELDAFGGKIRGDITDEWRPQHSTWTIATSAADLSLSQTAEAVGLADRVAGRVRAAKFTWRGDPREPSRATASLWSEITAPAWRNREADVVMFGAAFYNQQIDLQQLYIKQRKNQLTLTGQTPLPASWSDWLNADYRANISATISDVADFASLFGGAREDFGGVLAINGTIEAREHNIGGEVSAEGKAMKIFGSPIDQFHLKLNIVAGVAEIADFHLQRGDDFVQIQGNIDLLGEQGLRGTFELGLHNLSEYFPEVLPAAALNGRLDFYGRTATFDGAEFGNGANTVALSGAANFSDPANVELTLRPLSTVSTPWAAAGAECVNSLELLPFSDAPGSTRIDRIQLKGSLFTGLSEMQVQTDAGAQIHHIGCQGGRQALQIAISQRPQ